MVSLRNDSYKENLVNSVAYQQIKGFKLDQTLGKMFNIGICRGREAFFVLWQRLKVQLSVPRQFSVPHRHGILFSSRGNL